MENYEEFGPEKQQMTTNTQTKKNPNFGLTITAMGFCLLGIILAGGVGPALSGKRIRENRKANIVKNTTEKYVIVKDAKDGTERAININMFKGVRDYDFNRDDIVKYLYAGDTVYVSSDSYEHNNIINCGFASYNKDSINFRKGRMQIQQMQKQR